MKKRRVLRTSDDVLEVCYGVPTSKTDPEPSSSPNPVPEDASGENKTDLSVEAQIEQLKDENTSESLKQMAASMGLTVSGNKTVIASAIIQARGQ